MSLAFSLHISYDFNAFIMSEEGSTPVHLSHTTSIETISDFQIQGIDNQGPLLLTEEQSDNDRSLSGSAWSTAPSGLLTLTLGSNPADGSSLGSDWRIYERRRKVRKSWVYHPENGGEYGTQDGRT